MPTSRSRGEYSILSMGVASFRLGTFLKRCAIGSVRSVSLLALVFLFLLGVGWTY